MPNDSAVALIAPYVAQDLARAREQGEARPTLAGLAGRAAIEALPLREDLESWRVGLLLTLGLEHASARYPEGAVTAAAEREEWEGCWLRATPLNLTAGLSDLAASTLVGAHAVSDEERAALRAMLGEHLRSAGFELEVVGGQWVMRAPSALNASTRHPELAVRDLEAAMPTGPDARLLRRLMAELQMLLHEHPVNEGRARAGAPAANAIWLHGLGSAARATGGDLPHAFGNEPYLCGLYKLHGLSVQAPLHSAAELLEQRRAGRVLALVEDETLDALETRWLAPLLQAVRAGRILSLELILARWRIRLDRASSFKLWRRPAPLAEWPQ